jgi:hypothetical protein
MPNPHKTEIVVVLDRSGSMESIRKDMIGGFAHFVSEMRALSGDCVLSLYQFDDVYEKVFEEKPLADVGALVLEPRRSTALLDAVAFAIHGVGARLSAKAEDDRPGAVVVVIITDGHENSSKEYSRAHLRALISTQEKDFKWRFMYLGAEASSFDDAHDMGINTVAMYDASAAGVKGMAHGVARSVGTYRSAVAAGNPNAELEVPDTSAKPATK